MEEVETKILEVPTIGTKIGELRTITSAWAMDVVNYLMSGELPNQSLES